MQIDVSFKISDKDLKTVVEIVGRACKDAKRKGFKKIDSLGLQMDLVATHANGCPMRFDTCSRPTISIFGTTSAGFAPILTETQGSLPATFYHDFPRGEGTKCKP